MRGIFRLGLMSSLMPCLVAVFAGVPALGQNAGVTIEQLTRRAELVAVGKVSALESEWNESKTGIRTRVTLHVEEFVKGQVSGSSITLFVPGGEIGSVGEMYSHTPKFTKDESVVVFAEKDSQAKYRVSGGTEGKLTIKRDDATGRMKVSESKTLEQLTQQIRNATHAQDGN